MTLTADVAQVSLLGGGGLAQAGRGASTGRDVTGDATGADVGGGAIVGVEVRLDGRLLGLGQVGADLLDLIGLGLSHVERLMWELVMVRCRLCECTNISFNGGVAG